MSFSLSFSDLKPAAGARLRGKVLPIDLDRKAIERHVFRRLGELQPRSAEEVGTVAWLDRDREVEFHYKLFGTPAYRRTCRVTVIDLQTHTVLGEKTFYGGTPPSRVHILSGPLVGENYGSDINLDDVVRYLRDLRDGKATPAPPGG